MRTCNLYLHPASLSLSLSLSQNMFVPLESRKHDLAYDPARATSLTLLFLNIPAKRSNKRNQTVGVAMSSVEHPHHQPHGADSLLLRRCYLCACGVEEKGKSGICGEEGKGRRSGARGLKTAWMKQARSHTPPVSTVSCIPPRKSNGWRPSCTPCWSLRRNLSCVYFYPPLTKTERAPCVSNAATPVGEVG